MSALLLWLCCSCCLSLLVPKSLSPKSATKWPTDNSVLVEFLRRHGKVFYVKLVSEGGGNFPLCPPAAPAPAPKGSHALQQLCPALSDSCGCVCPALPDPAQLASVLRQFAHGPSRASPPRSLDIFRSLAVCGSVLRAVRSFQSWQTSPSSPSWPPSRPLRAFAKTIPTLVKSLAFGISIPTSCARPCICRAVQSFVYCRAGSPTPAPTSFSVQRRHLSNAIPTLSLCLPPYGLLPAA